MPGLLERAISTGFFVDSGVRTTSSSEGESTRDEILIALNTCRISRDAICRLARAPISWLDRQPDFKIGSRELVEARRICSRAAVVAREQQQRAERTGARLVTLLSDEYPSRLYDLDFPPPVLYIQGNIPNSPAIAIVGSRMATRAAIQTARLFGRKLAAAGLTVVSGFARGVDAAAHRGALEADGA